MRGNADNTFVVQIVQITVVAGETVDYSVGDFLLFHINHPFLGLKKFTAILAQENRIVNFFNNLF